MPAITDYVEFHDRKLARKYANRRIPMATLYEAYFDGDLDITGDIYEFLNQRDFFVKYSLTPEHARWAAKHFLPEVAIHSQEQDERIVREHYDRGNDFFEWFLGDRMVYTSAFFQSPDETLEQAQDNKLELAARKLQLKPGDRLLDIGCGWGTFAMHAAQHHGVDATGVTIAERQTEFANARIEKRGLSDSARVLCLDYRDIPSEKRFDKISSFEMVEHVGVKNLVSFYKQVYDLLADDGIFLLQWTGLRNLYSLLSPKGTKQMGPETLIWGLFMNKYIFPGADASLCLSPMTRAMEEAGFEIQTVENISIHYAWTIKLWHDNWLSNRDKVIDAYGERWFRIWHFFLAWSHIIAKQGNAACFQLVLNKNLDAYDRTRWVVGEAPVLGNRAPNLHIEAPASNPTPRPAAATNGHASTSSAPPSAE